MIVVGRLTDGERFAAWSLTRLADHPARKGVVEDISREGLRALEQPDQKGRRVLDRGDRGVAVVRVDSATTCLSEPRPGASLSLRDAIGSRRVGPVKSRGRWL
jgi:hypothetical protein